MRGIRRKPGRPLRRSWPQRLVLLANFFAILAALGAAWILNVSLNQTESVNRIQLTGTLTPPSPSTPGSRVLNILLVGSDSSDGLDPDNPVNQDRVGERNGDVIIIVHLDERDSTASLLSLPRDLWVEIAGADREAKINSAYAIGGAVTLIETIDLNFGIPINYFVNVDFAGFEGLVDAVGSVEVEFPAPARDWNSTFGRSQTGFEMLTPGCQALDPPTALAYVRSRYYQTQDPDGRWVTDPDGDLGRIRRQQDFLQRVIQRAIDLGARNPFVLKDLIETASDNVVIDQELTPQLLLDLSGTFASFQPGELETYSIPAEFGEVGTSSVLFVQQDEAQSLITLFRGAASDDPGTVSVRVVHDTESEGRAANVVEALAVSGFSAGVPSAATVGAGVVIRHGADGLQAAQLVAVALDGAVVERASLELIDGLRGRDVIVAVGPDASASAPSTGTSVAASDGDLTSSEPSDTSETEDGTSQPSTSDTPLPSNSMPDQAVAGSCS
jgi:LCP family protein required for cell wall assembly